MSKKNPADRQEELKERFQLPDNHYFHTRVRDKEKEDSTNNELNVLNKSGGTYMMNGSSYKKAIRTFESVVNKVYEGAPISDYNLIYALYGLTYSYSHWLGNIEDEAEWDKAVKKLMEYSYLALCYTPIEMFYFTDTAAFNREVFRIAGNAYAWWTMMLDGDLEEALAAIELAVINKESDSYNFIVDTKVRILLKVGRTGEAYQLVVRVLDKYPNFGDFQDFLRDENFLKWYEEVRGTPPTYGQKNSSDAEADPEEDNEEEDEPEEEDEVEKEEVSSIPVKREEKLWPQATVVTTVRSDAVYEYMVNGKFFSGFMDWESELYDKLVANGDTLVVEGDVHVTDDLLINFYCCDYSNVVVKGNLSVDGTFQLSNYYNPNLFVLGNFRAGNILFGNSEMWVNGHVEVDGLLLNKGVIRATETINAVRYYEASGYLEAADEPTGLSDDDFSKKLMYKGKLDVDSLIKAVVARKPYLK